MKSLLRITMISAQYKTQNGCLKPEQAELAERDERCGRGGASE